ncbi:TlpA disulfide reductase family protein [Pseudorhodoferax sp. Leaf267]|uniref:TlpA family protein disulfide reductase n=1 Tax=Pseudorhodoferax sp. Leaf267 TaxID=1736316 RepID=UPI0006F20686|nr:TlpA disulfide reductase family protein [Pseudorhodoferax sp. Leaf267]KQP12201.1 thioredoxin [Pseudorhodoferax sp. Leaf267]
MPVSRRSLISSAAVAAAWPFAATARAAALPAVGARLPLAEVALLDGSRFLPASADGKLLVVYWWASWCPFCAVQSPHIEALWQAQRAHGLSVLALSIDREPQAALNYIRQKKYSFPAGMLTPDVARTMPKPQGLPVTVVRGRDGRVVLAEAGEMFPDDIEGIAKFL